ncbi:MAG: Gfo/Idh/MocA family oxidoreductase, partial [Planctomycetaceae bacterium]
EFTDFRRMLDQATDVDAVLCATPDHTHAVVSVAAMRAGRHVYCEKPLTHNVAEARLVARVARETGLATQMGNQGHSNDGIRQTVEWVQAGAIGNVTAVHAWVPATRWNVGLKGAPTTADRPPAGLDWDLWLGPRDDRPFHSTYAPVSWRDYWQFGCGAMGDFGCHDLDSACWALNLKAPDVVEMHPAGYMDKDIAPYGEIGYFDFSERGDQKAVRITWYSGGLQPPRPGELPVGLELPRRGVLFVGDRGILVCGGAGGPAELFPESRRAEFTPPQPTIPRSNGHHRDWIDAIKGGPAASSNFEYGARLTEITLLGVASLRTGKRLVWDYDNMTAKGVPEAEVVLNGSYRPGWKPA